MIPLTIGCILAGCLQDVPVVVGTDPVVYHVRQQFKSKKKNLDVACYVEGVFYQSCPQLKYQK